MAQAERAPVNRNVRVADEAEGSQLLLIHWLDDEFNLLAR
jgi:hypothetical protein